MSWLWWRQFRVQAAAGSFVAVAFAGYLLTVGYRIREERDAYLARCADVADCAAQTAQFALGYENKLLFLAGAAYLIPVVLAMFWAAPIVAGELEQGTHKLVWNQSITRTRWLLTKVGLTSAVAAVLAGLVAAAMTWAAHPVDEAAGNRFDAIAFGVRHVVPVAFAVLAACIGVVCGIVTRRRMPAMALAGLVVVGLLFLVPNVVRPVLIPAKTENRPMTVQAINQARSLGTITGSPSLGGLRVEDAWVSEASPLLTRSGTQVRQAEFDHCFSDPEPTGTKGTFGDTAGCLAKLDLHVELRYQPDSRYWFFQGLESALYLLMAALASLLSVQLLRRRVT